MIQSSVSSDVDCFEFDLFAIEFDFSMDCRFDYVSVRMVDSGEVMLLVVEIDPKINKSKFSISIEITRVKSKRHNQITSIGDMNTG